MLLDATLPPGDARRPRVLDAAQALRGRHQPRRRRGRRSGRDAGARPPADRAAREPARLGFELPWRCASCAKGASRRLLIIVGVAAGVAVVAYISALVTGLQSNTLTKTLGAQAHVVAVALDERVLPVLPARVAGDAAFTDTQPRAQRLRSVANWQALMAVLEAAPGRDRGVAAGRRRGAGAARRGHASIAVAASNSSATTASSACAASSSPAACAWTRARRSSAASLAADLGVRVGDRDRRSHRRRAAKPCA